jgi:membrane fusion protein, multidrug efflux system
MTRRWRIGLVAALLVVLVAGLAWAMSRQVARPTAPSGRSGAPAARPVPVVVAPARARDMGVYLNGLGSVTPYQSVTVKTRVDGQLMSMRFKEGQLVKAGDLLAEIDPRPFQVQLEQAEGQMARDEALLRNARLDLDRFRLLLAQDSIASQQVDTQASLVRQDEGTVKMDQGVIDNAKLQLTYCRITAPLAGRVGLRLVDPGNIVHASDANGLVVITQIQPIAVLFTIAEDSLPTVLDKLRQGRTLPVDAYDREMRRKLSSGSLLTVDNQIDNSTGTVRLKAQFANADLGLFPNQFVNARLQVDVKRGAVVVPSVAVQRGTGGTFVYVMKPDKTVTARKVTLGVEDGTDVAIEQGLALGEQVVVDGADRLREGAPVEPQARKPA